MRLSLNYRDKYIDELDDVGSDRYTDTRTRWDFTAKYRMNDSWQLYTEIANLTNEPEYYYSGVADRALQYDEFGSSIALGIQYNYQN